MILETSRLIIRELSSEDVTEKYVGWLNDPDINGFLETRFNEQTTQTCLDFITHMNSMDTEYLFGIFNKDNVHLGNIKIGCINKNHLVGDVSYFVGEKEFWGQGLAAEAVSVVCNYGFETIGLKKICAGCYGKNFASLRVLMKVGFQVEGFLRSQVEFNNDRDGVFKLGVLKNELL